MAQYIQWPGRVTSINGITGSVTLVAGSNITITPSGQNITIAATGGGGGSGFDTIGTIDTGTPSADGLSASGTTLFAQSADATFPGMVNTTTQTFAGDKTLTGNLTLSALSANRALITFTGGLITTSATTATEIGYVNGVTSAIQTQLNGKQASGNYITALTGDGTAAGPGSAALTLATVNSNVGSFTYSAITVNAKGLVTAASSGVAPVTSVALSVPGSSIFGVTGSPVTTTGTLGLTTTGTSGGIPYFSSSSALSSSALLTANALVLGGGAGSAPAALGSLGTTSTVLHGNAAGAPTFGAVALASDVSGTLPIGNGGTGQTTKAPAFDALSPMTTAGDIIYGGASGTGTRLAVGGAGKVLRSDGTNPVYAYPEPTIASKTANYTTVANDNLLKGDSSGGTFTFTLLAAATAGSGKRYIFKKTDSSLTAITITDGTLTTTLNTQNEFIEVESDGTNWEVLSRYIPSVWIAYTPTFTGLGTVTSNSTFYKRIGDSIQVNSFFTTGTATAVPAKVSFPSGLSLDTGKTVGQNRCGSGNQVNATSTLFVLSDTGNTTVFEFAALAAGANFTPANGSAAFSNTTNTTFSALVPISGWNG